MLNKGYKDKNKFDNIDNNFNFKVKIFYNKYKQIDFFLNFYIYKTFIILSDHTQIYYYINYRKIFIFYLFYINILIFF